ncbi:hypothetical protein CK203_014933 [Vitis vinifera]|uniref:Uncharacterized protein n=1 Tax=Vitis vinifera TaxID=29760 RepID=A0A438JDC5_VITVI|nr:hypothetical protein CK203_014933 [Vitis vinifera]
MGSDFGGERKSETTAVRGAINGEKVRDVPGEEEKQHPSLGDGGGALSEVGRNGKKAKNRGKKWRCRLGEDCRGARSPRRRRTSLERCRKWPEYASRAPTRRRVRCSRRPKIARGRRVAPLLVLVSSQKWRSPPGAPSGMVRCRKNRSPESSPESSPEISPENFAGGNSPCFLYDYVMHGADAFLVFWKLLIPAVAIYGAIHQPATQTHCYAESLGRGLLLASMGGGGLACTRESRIVISFGCGRPSRVVETSVVAEPLTMWAMVEGWKGFKSFSQDFKEKEVRRNEDYKLDWLDAKKGKFLVNSYSFINFMGKALDVGLVAKKRMASRELMFSFRVGDALVGEETLLGQHGSFVGILYLWEIIEVRILLCTFTTKEAANKAIKEKSGFMHKFSELQLLKLVHLEGMRPSCSSEESKENSWVVAAF